MAIRIVLHGLSAISSFFMKRNDTLFGAGQNLPWLLAAAFSTCIGAAYGSDWPQFMGPNGDGTSPETGLLRAWPAAGPKVLWTVPLGAGYGGAAVRDGKVFVLDRQEQKQDVLRCLELATGKELWNLGYEAPGRIDHDGSRSTPAVTSDRVYAIGPFGNLRCVDIATHKLLWQKNIVTDFGASAPRWAVAQSPLLYKDMVIAAPQGGSVGLVAFDQATGQEKWRSEAVGTMAYGSPMLLQVDGIDQVAIVNGKGAAAVGAQDGKLLWQFAHPCKIAIPNITALGRGKFFITGAYTAGSAIFQVTRQDGKWAAQEVARIDKIGGHCHPGLAYQGHIYVLCNVNERSDGMVCFDSDGKLVWQTKSNPNFDKGGSVLTADGTMYAMDGRTGELHIVQPSPAGFKSLGQAKLLEGREIWAPLALADAKLLIRDQTQMKCLDIKAH